MGEQIFRCEALETWDRRVKTHKEQFEKEYDGSQVGLAEAASVFLQKGEAQHGGFKQVSRSTEV